MISMVVKLCRCCDKEVDKCRYITRLRKFGIGPDNDIINALSYEVVVPSCTNSTNGSESIGTIP